MVVGSLVFAAPAPGRRCALLLLVSTLAIGVAYLGDRRSPRRSLVACAASVVGGIGNGVQWIALVTAVQELTRAAYQARVLSLLEALASAMPGDRLPARRRDRGDLRAPRVGYAVAGAGVLVVLALAAARAAPGRLGARARAGPRKTACRTVQVPLQRQDPSRTVLTGP